MTLASPAHASIWLIVGLTIACIMVRPGRTPEALWAALGAAALVLFSLLSVGDALAAIRQGGDVYLFLIGMMLLAELAREEGLFDWLAAIAVLQAKGSAARLFTSIYLVGTLVTIFLSNDATAVVLTPAVYAAARRAEAPPLPFLYICAFIANAASFVLPISNPANLLVYGDRMPSLWNWLRMFGIPALLAIVATYAVLRMAQNSTLRPHIRRVVPLPALHLGGRLAAAAIGVTALVLLVASALGRPLGLPTFLAGTGSAIVILLLKREGPAAILRGISWSVLPLVAGLFVLMKGIERTGAFTVLARLLTAHATTAPRATAGLAGVLAALVCNAVNNLPLGLLANSLSRDAPLHPHLTGALLIGVDLGPNLSVTGSLATLLWLVALRREGVQVSAWQFLAMGCLIMPPALAAALLSLLWQ